MCTWAAIWRSGEAASSGGLQTPPVSSVPTTPSCDPQLLMLLSWHHSFSLLLHWVRGPARSTCPLCPGPYPCPSMGVRDKSVFYHCGYVIEIHKESLVLLSTWKRQYGSVPCQCCVDRNVTCTGENFYFHFCKQCTAWPEPGTRREWSTAGKELTWPLPLLLQFHGVSQEDAQASVFAGHSDLFNHTDVIHYNTIN